METTQTQRREITAFFDDRSAADRAMRALSEAGIPTSDVRLVEGQNTGEAAQDNRSFFEMLGDLFMPDDDRSTYAEGLRRGGYMISVTTSGTHSETVLDILDDEGSVDMDDRARSWEAEGWSGQGSGGGMSSGTGAMGSMGSMSGAGMGAGMGAGLGMGATTDSDTMSGDLTGVSAERRDTDYDDSVGGSGSILGGELASGATGSDDSGLFGSRHDRTTSQDASIPVVAEQLRVGKRDVANGRVRVRSYVVEEPVDVDVSLRSEHVEVHRTPVDRAVSAEDAFRDRTIEAEETSQEAVIAKDARVVEEISVEKTAEEHTETISDTVRRTEVEIDDERLGDSQSRNQQSR